MNQQLTNDEITERELVEAALRTSEERFRRYFDLGLIGMAITSPTKGMIEVNDELCRILGFERSELLEKTWVEMTYPEDQAADVAQFNRVLGGEIDGYSLDKRWICKDGRIIDTIMSAKCMRGADGSVEYFVGLIQDITERKRGEEALRASEERFRLLVEGVKDYAFFMLDLDGRVVTWNKGAETLEGYHADEILGRHYSIFYQRNDEDAQRAGQALEVATATGRCESEGWRVRKDGSKFWANATISALRKETGDLPGFAVLIRDMTIAHEAQVLLEKAYWEVQHLKDKLSQEKRYLEAEIRSEHGFEEIVGQSQAIRRVLRQVEKVAATSTTVLIQGETGTGKELIARAIHNLSPRRDKTFVKLNCAAIPTGLLESELFGHERGAFTGAIMQKIGRFELAHQGTIFLDEVGEIPLDLQVKLLRVLQEQEFERLGSIRTQRVDIRVLAATNRDLAQMVAEKQFRSDLYYRLNVFPINVPALRQRQDDIPDLVQFFTKKYARRLNKPISSISEVAMNALSEYSWPGNIRELENLIERCAILSSGEALEVDPSLLQLQCTPITTFPPATTLVEAERDLIRRTLIECKWILSGPSGAATKLGMKRTSLQYKMQKLGITRPQGKAET